MAYTLRRYCRRYLRVNSMPRWLCSFIIAMILISSYIVINYKQETFIYDYGHPVSFRWRNERLNIVVRPDLETAKIQPILGNDSICQDNIHHERLLYEELLQILILVMSAPPNVEARNAIRQSWGNKSFLPPEVEVFFILGTSNDEKLTEMVMEESEKYNDVIVEDFLDSYENLTYKTLFALKWTSKRCPTATHLFKTDDDMLIIPQNLIKKLIYIRNNYFSLQKISMNKTDHIQSAKEDTKNEKIRTENFLDKKNRNEKMHDNIIRRENHNSLTEKKRKQCKERIKRTSGAYFLGRVHRHVQPYRNQDSKWFLPFTLYYEDYLPDFVSGTAYIIANGNKYCGAIQSLFMKSLKVKPALPLEDVFLTGIVAEQLALPLIEDNDKFFSFIPLIFPWSLSRLATCSYYNMIAIHGLKPKDILVGWTKLQDLKGEECNTISGYIQRIIYKLVTIFEVPIG